MTTPGAIGPYRIVSVLGRGGMGVVYRGEHQATGEAAALKVVSSASAFGIAGVHREIHALGRVAHPGVVRVVDQGTLAGAPWYAMELLEGSTLRGVLDDHWARLRVLEQPGALQTAPTQSAAIGTAATEPGIGLAPTEPGVAPAELSALAAPPRAFRREPATRALLLCAALCEPLAAVHAAGLVHRDLKPDNVIVTRDGQPVLVDFGIAAGFGGAAGREVLSAAGDVAGTLEYMAPEQIRGELADARTDLYALGIMLYECLAGHTPFAGLSQPELLAAHVHEPPPPLGVAPELEALVMRLLEKRPADRIGYASDVASMLRDLGYGASERRPSAARPEPYLYRAELSGRGELMQRARAALDALRGSRRGGAIYAGGESGVGKTRLGVEITREAAQRGIQVLTGQCLPSERPGATPLHAFLPVAREAVARAHQGGGAARVGPRAKVLAPYFPELATLAGFAELPEPAPLSPDAARARVLDAAEALLLELAPLLLMLDDLHWADELSLALLGRLDARKLTARGLLCVGFYRAEEAGEALDALAGAYGVERWQVGRLAEGDVAAMAAGMLAARSVPEAWSRLLARVSSGNPFFASEYLRAAVEAGILTRDRRGEWSIQAADASRGAALALPTTLGALLDARFDRLGSAERRLLAAASVLGRTLAGDVAGATAGMDERAALDALSVLARRQILEEAPGGQLRFVHDRLRNAAYARLGAEERRALHGSAAETIEARYGDDPAQLALLASHHAGAERHDKAYGYFVRAAAHAEAGYANEQAIALLRGALEQAAQGGAGDAEQVESGGRLGGVLLRVGKAEEARAAYEDALGRVGEDDVVKRAELHLASEDAVTGRLPSAS